MYVAINTQNKEIILHSKYKDLLEEEMEKRADRGLLHEWWEIYKATPEGFDALLLKEPVRIVDGVVYAWHEDTDDTPVSESQWRRMKIPRF